MGLYWGYIGVIYVSYILPLCPASSPMAFQLRSSVVMVACTNQESSMPEDLGFRVWRLGMALEVGEGLHAQY